jgi:hypothetical protein
MSFLATTGGLAGEDVRDLMVAAVEYRFGQINRLPVIRDDLLAASATTQKNPRRVLIGPQAAQRYRPISTSMARPSDTPQCGM